MSPGSWASAADYSALLSLAVVEQASRFHCCQLSSQSNKLLFPALCILALHRSYLWCFRSKQAKTLREKSTALGKNLKLVTKIYVKPFIFLGANCTGSAKVLNMSCWFSSHQQSLSFRFSTFSFYSVLHWKCRWDLCVWINFSSAQSAQVSIPREASLQMAAHYMEP